MSTTPLLAPLEYSFYVFATIIACVYSTEAQHILVHAYHQLTRYNYCSRWNGGTTTNNKVQTKHSEPPPPPRLIGTITTSTASILSDLSNQQTDESSKQRQQNKHNDQQQQATFATNKRKTDSRSFTKKLSFASNDSDPNSTRFQASEHSFRSSCLKKRSSLCSNAKKPIRQASDDTIQVSFAEVDSSHDTNAHSEEETESEGVSWASEEVFAERLTGNNSSMGGAVSLPKSILPACAKLHTVAAPNKHQPATTSASTSNYDDKPVAPKSTVHDTHTTNALSGKRSIDSHIVQRSIGIRLRHKIQRHSSFDSGVGFHKRRGHHQQQQQQHCAQTLNDKIKRYQGNLMALSETQLAASPLDITSSLRDETNEHTPSERNTNCSHMKEANRLPRTLLTRRSSVQKSTPREGMTPRSNHSSRFPSDSALPPKQGRSRRELMSRSLSSDWISTPARSLSSNGRLPTTSRVSAMRRTIQRASSTMVLDTEANHLRNNRHQQLHSTWATNDGAPRVPARSSSHDKRQNSSSRGQVHRLPAPPRNHSFGTRPSLVKHTSTLTLGRQQQGRSAISTHDRKILQRVQSCRDIFA